MANTQSNSSGRLGLHAGDIVYVRSAEEILATLDENGELEALPFMPEMLPYCGKQFRVYKRADKTCDTVNYTGNRRLKNTVHLEGLRCDGSAHAGCQAGCLLYWKEAWLTRELSEPQPTARMDAPRCNRETLQLKSRKFHNPAEPGEDVFSCQATELPRFTTPMSPWDVRQYWRDIFSGNEKLPRLVRFLGVLLFNQIQRIRGGGTYPLYFRASYEPAEGKTPAERLDLQPGELVQIKDRIEILKTLDGRDRNRGLLFDNEMVKYCGESFRVLRRVDHIINENTGKMMKFKNECIILEGVSCASDYHGLCPRNIHHYWREAWLRRVDS